MNDNHNNSGLDIIVEAIDEAGIDIMNEPLIPKKYKSSDSFISIDVPITFLTLVLKLP